MAHELVINMRMEAVVDLQAARQKALQQLGRCSEKLIWYLDCGLFDALRYPLAHEGQYVALQLALEHFFTVLWAEFSPFSRSVSLYRGRFPKDLEERNLWGEYLQLLTHGWMHKIPLEIAFEGGEETLVEAIALSHPDAYGKMAVLGKGCWHLDKPAAVGVYLPEGDSIPPEYHRILETLYRSGQPYKIIPEGQLTIAWAGLDILICKTDLLSTKGRRALQGFIAAGGVVEEIF